MNSKKKGGNLRHKVCIDCNQLSSVCLYMFAFNRTLNQLRCDLR